ncbi:hypothetical protein RB195_011108 [Necator americanus]|uniref:Ubiquitin-like domain-containing protein n=1 Tax=Necator americanus TaxID=51031 RepID=A0ABR1D2S7_NECAM
MMFMRNGWVSDAPFTLNGTNISECTSYVYLGRELNMMNDLIAELGRRRRAAWGAYKSIEGVVKKSRNTLYPLVYGHRISCGKTSRWPKRCHFTLERVFHAFTLIFASTEISEFVRLGRRVGMIFVKTLSGRTLTLEEGNVLDVKSRIEALEGLSAEDQRLIFAGRQLEDDDEVEPYSTLHLSLRLLGGAKKRKKKVYTTPKKIKHKRKKVKLAVLKYYEVDENGKIRRLRKECQSPSCGGGVFMAAHENRYYCGRCHDTLVVEEPVVTSKGKGGKGKK